MDKLQYDSLYKFLVSLGLIMIALPIAVLAYLLNSELVLINQEDFETLSQLSKQMLTNREKLLVLLRCIFPWFAVIFIILGMVLLAYGLYKWRQVQMNLDIKLGAETTIQTLNAMKMNPKEINRKISAEIKESGGQAIYNTVNTPLSQQPNQNTSETYTKIQHKYAEIEQKCFDYVVAKYGRKYHFTKNIQMGHYSYDLIGVSKKDNVDILIELKYWPSPLPLSNVTRVFKRLSSAGVNYETISHRNFKTLLLVITPESQLLTIQSWLEKKVNLLYMQEHNLTVECVAEEIL